MVTIRLQSCHRGECGHTAGVGGCGHTVGVVMPGGGGGGVSHCGGGWGWSHCGGVVTLQGGGHTVGGCGYSESLVNCSSKSFCSNSDHSDLND